MRMSNEDFQAEVFRRSAAYQKKQRTRIRILTGAGAFACCLCLTAALGVFMPRLQTAKHFENAAETMQMDAAEPTEGGKGAEQVDEAADEAPKTPVNEAPQDTPADADTAPNENAEAESAEEPEPEYDGPTVFVEKTDEELLDYYGLDSLPAAFDEDIQLGSREKFWGIYRQYPHGLTVAENDPDTVTNDRNTWVYLGDMRFVYLTLFKWKYGNSEPQYDHEDRASEHESITDYALFTENGIGVQISYSSFEPEDFEDQKMIKAIVQEMQDFIYEHKT